MNRIDPKPVNVHPQRSDSKLNTVVARFLAEMETFIIDVDNFLDQPRKREVSHAE